MTEQTSPALLGAERRSHVLAALARDGAVRIAQLVDDLDVAPVTLRRDLAQMEREGLLVRVHGGAVAADAAHASAPETRTIAVLVPSLNYYWPGVIRGMEREARDRGCRILLRGASYDLQDERPVLERLTATEDLAGLIVAPNTETAHSQDVIAWLDESDIPFVLVERDAFRMPSAEPVESVTTDHALGGALAARHLVALGHRRVGLVLSRQSPTSRKIVAGWHAACDELMLEPGDRIEHVLPDRSNPGFSQAVHAALDAALDAGVTGLLVHSDPEAMAVVDLAEARGLTVPGDISVVAYDDEVAELFTPALTAVSPPRAAVGHAAVELLTGRIAQRDRAARRVQLSPRLIVRESTAAPRTP